MSLYVELYYYVTVYNGNMWVFPVDSIKRIHMNTI